jgi:hypothetical protein
MSGEISVKRLTTDRSIMFNPIVEIYLFKVNSVFVVVLVEHCGSVFGNVIRERFGEIVRGMNETTHFLELDIFAIARKNA